MLNIIKGKQNWAREEAWVSSRLSPFQHRDHKTANSPPHCQLATLFTMHFQHYPSTHTSQPTHTTHMLVSTRVWVSTVWAGWVSTAGNITVADPCQPFPRCCRLRGKLSRNWARKAPLKTNQELFLLLTFWINRITPFGKWKWKWKFNTNLQTTTNQSSLNWSLKSLNKTTALPIETFFGVLQWHSRSSLFGHA